MVISVFYIISPMGDIIYDDGEKSAFLQYTNRHASC